MRGIHRSPVDSPHKKASNTENVSVWWRNHVFGDVIVAGCTGGCHSDNLRCSRWPFRLSEPPSVQPTVPYLCISCHYCYYYYYYYYISTCYYHHVMFDYIVGCLLLQLLLFNYRSLYVNKFYLKWILSYLYLTLSYWEIISGLTIHWFLCYSLVSLLLVDSFRHDSCGASRAT